MAQFIAKCRVVKTRESHEAIWNFFVIFMLVMVIQWKPEE